MKESFAFLLVAASLILAVCLYMQASSTVHSSIKSADTNRIALINNFLRSENILQQPAPQGHNHGIENAIAKIEQSEYSIYYRESEQELQSRNRAHNMCITYHADGFEVKSRTERQSWNIAMKVKGVHRGNTKVGSLLPKAKINLTDNQLVYHHDFFDVEYINTQKGMRQNFIVHQKPKGKGPLKVKLEVQADNITLQCNGKELIATQSKTIKFSYHDLKVWDADYKRLSSHMELTGDELALVVDDSNACYPVTIDPLSTTPALILESDQAGALMGYSVASAGDVNGDGYNDVIVGAYQYDNGQAGEGAAFVYHGSASGISMTPASTIESNQADANIGYSVASAGDVNGDGYGDVIVGARYYDNGQIDEGAAFVYHGSANGISTTPASILESNQADARMGRCVALAGDVNGDGYSDVIVDASRFDNGQIDEGAAFVYHGSASGVITTPAVMMECNQAGAWMGNSVATAGDVNGDGYSDVIVGAPYYDNGQPDEGRAYVYLGSAGGVSATPANIMESDQAIAYMGRAVASAGDVNADGYSDVIIGAYYYDNVEIDEGRVYIYHGSGSGLSTTPASLLESNQDSAYMGRSVASAGDVNGDGYSDVIVGSKYYDNGQIDEGAAFVHNGSASGISTTPSAILESNQEFADMGYAVASAGDVNSDGFSDVIVGVQFYDNGQNNEGAAFVYHGGLDPCISPESLSATNITPSTVQLNWNKITGAIVYQVMYKAFGTAEGTLMYSTNNQKNISGLTANTVYVWQVKSVCNKSPLILSGNADPAKFTTAPLRLDVVHELTHVPEVSFLEVYPNPVQNQLTVSMVIPPIEVTIRIISLQGKTIDLPTTFQNAKVQINTTALPVGFYILQITNKKTGTSEVCKIVKQE